MVASNTIPRFVAYDRTGASQGDLDGVTKARLTRGVDGTDTLEMTLIDGEWIEKNWRIVGHNEAGELAEWIVTSPKSERKNSRVMTSIVAQGSKIELDSLWVDEKRFTGKTVMETLTALLDGSRWTAGDSYATTVPVTLSFYHETVWSAVKKLASYNGLLNLEPLVTLRSTDGYTITGRALALGHIGQQPEIPRRFEFGRDLIETSMTVSSENVITRLYGYGKGMPATDGDGNETGGYTRKISFASVNDGREYVEDTSLTAQWGVPDGNGGMMPACGIFEDSDEEDPASLLASTKRRLAVVSKPQISYTADVAPSAVGAVGLGDVIQIIDSAFSPRLELEARVTKIITDLLDPQAGMSLTLGDVMPATVRVDAARLGAF